VSLPFLKVSPSIALQLPVTPRDILRTPEACFSKINDFPYLPKYTEVGGMRIAHIDEGPRDGPAVLLMHGEPTWSYLYRKMIPVLVAEGCRVLVPDLVGFGRSDKPRYAADISYLAHVQWMSAWMQAQELRNLTLFCQDWGSLIGLRLVAQAPERFDRVVLGNGGLPTGTTEVPIVFKLWRFFARYSPWFPIGRIVKAGCAQGLSTEAIDAYNAPFPSSAFRKTARVMPALVPTEPSDPESERNESAWVFFKTWEKPFITLFSSRDPITRGGEKMWQQWVPGAQHQAHVTIRGAGHFLQEDRGPEVAKEIIDLIRRTPIDP
jgi:haloalkane dehalogenase|tara:strand:- start:5440 stop:6402 length:963 start_codon:yes stop_codon:yes gene_type:complete